MALKSLVGDWKDPLQSPVEVSQVFIVPSESLEIVIPSFACRMIDVIGAEVRGVDFGSVVTGSADRAPICQNLIDWSLEVEMRVEEEENAREVISSVWPMKVLTR